MRVIKMMLWEIICLYGDFLKFYLINNVLIETMKCQSHLLPSYMTICIDKFV